jgi:outer membrane protein OmpU
MRKLLLGTTALAAAATLSANVALADVSITGAMEWTYESRDPGTSAVGASDDDFSSDTNVKMTFSNKTDSGLEIGMVLDLETIGDDAASGVNADENYMFIKGGFGEIQLGMNDGAGDQFTRTASDLSGPDANSDNGGFYLGTTGSTAAVAANELLVSVDSTRLADDNADLIGDINDTNSITYLLPSMGGFSAGVSYSDAGDAATKQNDITTVGAKYAFESGAVKGSIHYGNSSRSGATTGASSLNGDSIALDLSSGPFRAVIAKANQDMTGAVTTEVTDYGVSYNLGNGMTLSAVGTQVEENTGGESSDITTLSASYNIASGLTAYLTYVDYDYENGTSATSNVSTNPDDDGSVTYLTVKATF